MPVLSWRGNREERAAQYRRPLARLVRGWAIRLHDADQ
jgi:hypothetical protein